MDVLRMLTPQEKPEPERTLPRQKGWMQGDRRLLTLGGLTNSLNIARATRAKSVTVGEGSY